MIGEKIEDCTYPIGLDPVWFVTDNDLVFTVRLMFSIGCGFVLYIPVISMLMDIFIWTEKAQGSAFFDIDWNSECWDSEHN